MKTSKIVSLIIVVLLIAAVIAYLEMHKAGPSSVSAPLGDDIVLSATTTAAAPAAGAAAPSRSATIAAKVLEYPRAKEIVDPTGFINTPNDLPITISQYIGKKVILIDFWTYSCINCQRTIPYLNDWYTKYEDKGLVVIGIHTPEFDFEKDINNVKTAVKKFGIQYPVVLDSDYGTWNAYGNLYWPREYLIDIDGFIREDHIGEGGYSDTENTIQKLLMERADELGTSSSGIATTTVSNPAPQMPTISQETYFGSARGMDVASDLIGNWNIQPQYAESTGDNNLVFPYTSKYVYVVAESDTPSTVEIMVDGKTTGNVSVSNAQLYTLVSGNEVSSHTLTLKIKDPGVKIFTLTFGS